MTEASKSGPTRRTHQNRISFTFLSHYFRLGLRLGLPLGIRLGCLLGCGRRRGSGLGRGRRPAGSGTASSSTQERLDEASAPRPALVELCRLISAEGGVIGPTSCTVL